MARLAISICLVMVFLAAGVFAIEIGDYSDPAIPIKSESGKIIIITLQSNRTTGYEWQIAEPLDTKIIGFMRSEYIPSEPQAIGSGGTEVWSFRAMGEGNAKIKFKYVRPWEKDTAPVKKMSFDIVVVEPKIEEIY